MVIGLKYGRTSAGDQEARNTTRQHIQTFVEKFKERHGTIVCRELLGCDISTDKGYDHAVQNHLFDTLCPRFVRDAAEILEDIL